MTPTYAARVYGVSYPAANTAVAKLGEMNILTELTGRSYDRVFAARDVLNIVEP